MQDGPVNGQQIREARQRAGLTQTQLGGLVGVSHAAIAGWERGQWQPSAEHGRALHVLLAPFDQDQERAALVSAYTAVVDALADALGETES